MYDNFATVNNSITSYHVLQIIWKNLENQLWRLYIEINGIFHDFLPDISDMPELEDITVDDDI